MTERDDESGLEPTTGGDRSAEGFEESTTDESTTDESATEGSTTDESADEVGGDESGSESEEIPADEVAEPVDEGELLFYEPGGSWWVVAIGPVLVGAVLTMEILGPGSVHWLVLGIFAVLLIGFSLVQVHAARTHVSVRLTEATLRQGTRVLPLSEIATVYPENTGGDAKTWESARALGELPAVPRRRKGVGVKLTDGTIAQAWARDVDRFRQELTEAHQAVAMGLPPRGGRAADQ